MTMYHDGTGKTHQPVGLQVRTKTAVIFDDDDHRKKIVECNRKQETIRQMLIEQDVYIKTHLNRDIKLVIQQLNCDQKRAIELLHRNDYNVFKAIMDD